MDKKRGRPAESRTARATKGEPSPPPASRTRSKSPARVEFSGRDSARITKAKRASKKESEESSSQSSTPKKELKKTKKSPIVILDDSGDNDEVAEINTRSTRLKSLRKRNTPISYKNTPTPNEKRSISRSVSSLTKEDSDAEVEIVEPEGADLGILGKPWLLWVTLLKLIFVPIVLKICYTDKLTLARFIGTITSAGAYCNKQSGAFFIAYISGTTLLSLLPLARVVKLPGSDEEYKFKGLWIAGVIVTFLVGLEIYGLDSLTAVINNVDRFLLLSIFVGLGTSIFLYVKAKRSPPEDPNPLASGRFIVNFSFGAEINPVIFNRIDVKSLVYIRSVIMILIINLALLYKNVTIPRVEVASGLPIGELIKETLSNLIFVIKNAEYNATALVISGLLVLYALDLLIFEHHRSVSYAVSSEGVGAEFILRHATAPFLLSFLPRFVLAQNIRINNILIACIAIVFILGLIIKRCSCCLRYHYRLKPKDPKYKQLKTLPTLQNHRLIVSRWWSTIRKPNLFGEIVLLEVLLVPLFFKFSVPACLGILFIIGNLISRSIIINRRNELKYESSWQRYVDSVKYNLIPRVY